MPKAKGLPLPKVIFMFEREYIGVHQRSDYAEVNGTPDKRLYVAWIAGRCPKEARRRLVEECGPEWADAPLTDYMWADPKLPEGVPYTTWVRSRSREHLVQ